MNKTLLSAPRFFNYTLYYDRFEKLTLGHQYIWRITSISHNSPPTIGHARQCKLALCYSFFRPRKWRVVFNRRNMVFSNIVTNIIDAPRNGNNIPRMIIIATIPISNRGRFSGFGAPRVSVGFLRHHMITELTDININPIAVSKPSSWFGQPNNWPSCAEMPMLIIRSRSGLLAKSLRLIISPVSPFKTRLLRRGRFAESERAVQSLDFSEGGAMITGGASLSGSIATIILSIGL
jgi:hypothetical protein